MSSVRCVMRAHNMLSGSFCRPAHLQKHRHNTKQILYLVLLNYTGSIETARGSALNSAFFLMANRGRLPWLFKCQKDNYCSFWHHCVVHLIGYDTTTCIRWPKNSLSDCFGCQEITVSCNFSMLVNKYSLTTSQAVVKMKGATQISLSK